MDILIYTLMLFVSFLGLFIGMILSNIAFEEINHISLHSKYFNIILVPILTLIAIYDLSKLIAIILSVIIFVILFIFKNKNNNTWTYACMGALIYVSTLGNDTLNVAILIFLYGVSVATIDAGSHFKNKINEHIKVSENFSLLKKLLGKYSYYLLIGIIFYVTFSYIL